MTIIEDSTADFFQGGGKIDGFQIVALKERMVAQLGEGLRQDYGLEFLGLAESAVRD